MVRPLRDSEYIFGIHDPGGEQEMLDASKPGWVLFTEKIGSNRNDRGGKDFRPWSDRGLGVMVRLNNGYEPEGTIPLSSRYGDFAERCGNYVRASQGCHVWIIGNEMNFVVERPSFSRRGFTGTTPSEPGEEGAPHSPRERPDRFNALHPQATRSVQSAGDREVITPALYAQCYRLCRDQIHAQPGHEDDQVLIGAVAPWNTQTKYDGNPGGDWVQYFRDILNQLGPNACDGITIHTYTHGDDPNLIYSNARMDPPFHNYHYHFFAYRDFMNAIPANMRHLPVYITETDQDVTWRNENSGWIQRAYGEINWWNEQPGNQQIRALVLYRWPHQIDRWYIEGKERVIEDFRLALQNEFVWGRPAEPVPDYRATFLSGGDIRNAQASQVLSTSFTLHNDGAKTWSSGGPNPVHIGYHWETASGEAVILSPEQDLRTALPQDVAPDESVTVDNVRVAMPEQAGAFKLRWDLVEEGVTWFKDQGSEENVETVTLTAPPPVEQITVPETGKIIKGAFLTWYRDKGLDVTGYPISDQFVDLTTGLPTQYFQRIVMEEPATGTIRLRLAGTELANALNQISSLNDQVNDLLGRVDELEILLQHYGGVIPRIPKPDIPDITDQLVRTPEGFYKRELSAVRYLVINHTGGSPSIPVSELTKYHRRRGYPGLAYHYIIGADGNIYQTNPLTDTVSDQGYLGEGINIALAGSFSQKAPPDVQLQGAAALCAWLLQEFSLQPEAIKGVSEFVSHGSPGWQWLNGVKYKFTLLDMVDAVEPVDTPVDPGSGDTTGLQQQIAALQAQVASLQADLQAREVQVDNLQSQLASLQTDLAQRADQVSDLQAQLDQRDSQLAALQGNITQLQSDLQARDSRIAELEQQVLQTMTELAASQQEVERLRAALADCNGDTTPRAPRPGMHDVVDQLLKHPTKTYDTRNLDRITHICIHHSATAANISLDAIAEYHVNGRDWPGIGYHFYVKPDGTIYQTNHMETVSYHVGWNNDYTVGICVSGDFTYAVPTQVQLDSAARLSAWLMQELDIPPENVLGHKEYPRNDTSCPGVNWLERKTWRNSLFQRIQEVQAAALAGVWPKTLYHYVLFWQHPEDWAQQDWYAAENYIGAFRPTAGFSVDDAKQSEYVTIVGGVAGVSYEAEALLRAAGCQVERLAGADFAATKRMMDELARTGRRFRDYPG